MCKKNTLTIVAVAILALAMGQVQAGTVTVPNNSFELFYQPGTAITGNISTGGWTLGVGPNCPIESGSYEFSDGTTGTEADILGWLGYDRQVWIDAGGTYGRDETTGNLQGSVGAQVAAADGVHYYLSNGGGWGNAAGGLIVSDASLGNVKPGVYTLSMFAAAPDGPATPVVLDLLADGVVVTPTSSVDPELSADWQEYIRTYDFTKLTSYVGKPMTIVLGVGRDASGAQSLFDNVSLGVDHVIQASDPIPADEATDVYSSVVLTWTPGIYADTHDVYFGESFDDVNNAVLADAHSAGQAAFTYDPGRLDFGRTYYWRVDEVNGTPDKAVFKGAVWSFEVEPVSIRLASEAMTVTASSTDKDTTEANRTIDGSGLAIDPNTGNALHSTEVLDVMWMSAAGDMSPSLTFEFDQAQKLDKLLIWNSNHSSESVIGWGIKDVDIQVSIDGTDWTSIPDVGPITQGSGSVPIEAQALDMGLAVAKYVKLNILTNWGGVLAQYGVAEVQFYALPTQAREPMPESGSVDVLPNTVVSWRAGREASQHTVYVSSDMDAVADGSADSVSPPTNSLDLTSLDLQMGQTFYWRVDEVNDAEVPSVWAGPVWSLSTPSAMVVDDFESYGNVSPDRPFQTWLDGIGYSADDFFPVDYAGNGTGAGVGHNIWSVASEHYNGSIMETVSTIAGSNQSLPFYYTNSGGVASKAERTFAEPQDWTIGGGITLSIPFLGQTSNTGTLYIKINGVKVTYPGDAADIALGTWQTWEIDLSSMDVANVTTLEIGVDGSNAAGLILIDDIRLYPEAEQGPVALPGSVPNGDFESIFKPGSYSITADLNEGWTQGVGADAIMDSGTALYSDGTSGNIVDIPGWIGAEGWEGSYDRDTAFPNRQGSVQASGVDGSYAFLANGGAWGNANGGLIVSADSLGDVEQGTYTLTMVANGGATPVVLELLAGGVVVTPSSLVDPTLTADYQEFSRTYDAASLAGFLGEPLTIRLGVGRNAEGDQTRFDNVDLLFEAGQ